MDTMRSATAPLCFMALLGWASHHMHTALTYRHLAPKKSAEFLWPTAAVTRMALNNRSAVSDLYYLRAINTFGDRKQHAIHYPWLAPMLTRAVTLDPLFLAPYLLAGNALVAATGSKDELMALLERGMEARPDSWRIAFLHGFAQFYLYNDDRAAAQSLSKAASLPEAPTHLLPLALQLSATAHTPESGLALVETLAQSQGQQEQRAELDELRAKLLLEIWLKRLEQACHTFYKTYGRSPGKLSALVESNIVTSVPADPLGGEFFIDDSGQVKTHHEAQRLTISHKARAPHSLSPKGQP